MASVLGIFIGVILGVALLGCLGWVAYLHLRARRLGLPPPTFKSYFQSPSNAFSSTRDDGSGGMFGFLRSKLPGGKKNTGTSRGNFGPLADDGAWDARVDTRYYEDAEMGLHASPDDEHPRDPRGGSDRPSYADHWNDGLDSPPRGRSRSRSPRFEDAHETLGGPPGGSRGGTRDPFSDAHAVEAQPRKSDGFGRPVGVKGGLETPRQSLDVGGGQSDRRSIFREQMD